MVQVSAAYLFFVRLMVSQLSSEHVPVAELFPRDGKLAELVADHFFSDCHGQVMLAVVHQELESAVSRG